MRKGVLFYAVLAGIRLVNNLRNDFAETSSQVCATKVIERIFREETVYFIFNASSHLLPFHVQNVKIVIRTNDNFHPTRRGNFNNFIIQVEDIGFLRGYVDYMTKSSHSSKRNSPAGKYLIITNRQELVKAIFIVMWFYRRMYVAVLVVDKGENTNSRIFSANPFDEGNRCGKMIDNIQVQFCDDSIPKQMFKLIKNYNACPVLVGSFAEEFDLFDQKNFTVRMAMETLNISFGFFLIDPLKPNRMPPGSMTCAASILNQEGARRTHTSHIYSRDSLVWIVPPPDTISSLQALISLFKVEVWIFVGGTFVLFTLVLYFLGRFETSLGKIVFNILYITVYGITARIPKATVLRFLIICYIIYSVHIQTAYVSNLRRSLVSPPKGKPILNLDELLATSTHILIDGMTATTVSIQNHNARVERIRNLESHSTILFNLTSKELLKIWTTQKNFSMPLLLNVLRSLELVLRIPSPNYLIDNMYYPTVSHVFVAGIDAYIIDSLDDVIDGLTESGIYEKLNQDRKSHIQFKKREFIFEEGVVPLSLNHLAGVFIMFGFGLLLSVIVFVGEIIFYRTR